MIQIKFSKHIQVQDALRRSLMRAMFVAAACAVQYGTSNRKRAEIVYLRVNMNGGSETNQNYTLTNANHLKVDPDNLNLAGVVATAKGGVITSMSIGSVSNFIAADEWDKIVDWFNEATLLYVSKTYDHFAPLNTQTDQFITIPMDLPFTP